MLRVVRDPALAVAPTPPQRRPPLPFDAAPLRAHLDHAIALRSGSVTIVVDRARSPGLYIDDLRIMDHVSIGDAAPHSVDITSIGLVRTFTDGATRECTLFLPDSHDIIMEWVCDVDSLAVKWTCVTSHDDDATWNADDHSLVIDIGAKRITYQFDSRVIFGVAQSGDDIVIAAHVSPSDGRARLHAFISDTHAAASDAPASTSEPHAKVTATHNTDAAARAIIGSQKRRIAHDLALGGDALPLNESLQWAKHAIATYRSIPRDDFARHALRRTLAALAVGNIDVARSCIVGYAEDDAALLLMLARYQSFTADPSLLVERFDRVRRAAANTLADITARNESDAKSRLILDIEALASIADAAGDAGRSELTTDLNPRVRQLRVEHAPALRAVSWLDALGIGHVFTAPPPLAQCLSVPESVILPLYYRLLDAAPEAMRHRFRIAPSFPPLWGDARVCNARMGDASIDITYAKSPNAASRVYKYEAVQEHGGVPARLILEPRVPIARIRSIRIDGAEAELDPVPESDLMRVPVQLVLDEHRVLEFETDPEAGAEPGLETEPPPLESGGGH